LKDLENIEKNILLFMHVPLHKKEGVCMDSPMIKKSPWNTVIEQNMLSEETTNYIIKRVKPKFIFTGHDHEGCIYKHEPGNITE